MPFRDRCMSALKTALSHIPDLKIVVSSSWREEMDLDTLKELLAGLDVPIIGVTPVINDPYLRHVREHECRAWLTSNPADRYFAIDDAEGFFSDRFPVFWVDGCWGFVEDLLPAFRAFIEGLELADLNETRRGEVPFNVAQNTWDDKVETDIKGGKLDGLADEAIREYEERKKR